MQCNNGFVSSNYISKVKINYFSMVHKSFFSGVIFWLAFLSQTSVYIRQADMIFLLTHACVLARQALAGMDIVIYKCRHVYLRGLFFSLDYSAGKFFGLFIVLHLSHRSFMRVIRGNGFLKRPGKRSSVLICHF